MYSLLIADDEPFICDGISAALESLCPKVQITAVFNDGKALLDYISKNHSDIVISDIRMGMTSGIDIAKYIKTYKPDTHLILITGYKLFEYANSAINLHVDYLFTKLIPSKEIAEAVNSIVKCLDKNFENAIAESKLIISDWNLRKNTIKNIFYGNKSDADSFPTERFISQNDSVCELHYRTNCEDKILADKTVIDLGEYSYGKTQCFFAEKKEPDIFFVALFDGQFDKSISESFLKSIKMVYGINMSCSYRFFKNITEYTYFCKARIVFNDIICYARKSNPINSVEYANEKISVLNEAERKTLIDYISENTDFTEREEDIYTTIKNVVNSFSSEAAHDNIGEQARRYILDHYLDYDLTLMKTAESLNVSQEHLSRVFKECFGIGFKAYLQKIRIDKAKNMLISTNKSSSEIAKTVGYSSVSHFKQIFKKATGCSLAEYKKKKKRL